MKYLVTGSSGHIGKKILYDIATKYPKDTVKGMMMSATPGLVPSVEEGYPNIEHVSPGFTPQGFTDLLKDIDVVVHCVLQNDYMDPELMQMNSKECVNIANTLDFHAKKSGKKRTFIFVASAKPAPLVDEYITQMVSPSPIGWGKLLRDDTEEYLMKGCKHLDSYVIKSGIVWSEDDSIFTKPMKVITEALFQLHYYFIQNFLPFGFIDSFFPV